MKSIKFLRATLDALPVPAPGDRAEYQDAQNPHLRLRVTANGTKSFFLRRKIAGKAVRVTLGTYKRAGDRDPVMTVEQARRAADRALGKAVEGVNPNEAKRAARVEGMSLRKALELYVEDNRRLKPSTAAGYEAVLIEVAKDWMDRPLREVTEDRLLRRHSRHGERSPARANQFARVLRAVWNYARTFNPKNAAPIYGDNPVSILSARKAWYRVERRRTRIKDHALPAWWAGVERLRESRLPAGRDAAELLTVLLFTGLRPIEACELRWAHVDLGEGTIEIPDPKNREPHVLPLSTELLPIFQRRADEAVSDYVFPATRDPARPFQKVTLHKFVRLLRDETGVEFTPYDLRRGFATVAESLDLSGYAVKRLLNHRTIEADVTAGYIGRDNRRLADAMQRISDRIQELTTAAPPDNLVAFPQSRGRAAGGRRGRDTA